MEGYVRKKGDTWYYSFEVGKVDGKRKRIERKGGRTKKEAMEALRTALSDFKKSGAVLDESDISVSDYFDYWYKEYVLINCKYNTQQGYRRVIDGHIKPALGHYRLKNITPAVLQEFLNKKSRNGLTKNTVSNFYGVLSGALKKAVYPYQLIKQNPLQYVSLPKYDEKPKNKEDYKILTISQFNDILKRFPFGSTFYMPLMLGFHTGCRAAEVCGLTWDNIDFENKTITIDKIIIKKGREWIHSSPKTLSSNRTIVIGSTLLTALRKHKKWQSENKLKYGDFYTATDFVCTKENGEPVTTDSLKYLSRVVRLELQINFNFHSLRHTHATMLLENGAHIKDIQKRLGHSKLSTTMDTYSHVTQKMQFDTVNLFEDFLLKQK